MAQALRQINDGQQLGLYGRGRAPQGAKADLAPQGAKADSAPQGAKADRFRARPVARVDGTHTRPCAGCRAREARYGFRDEAHPQADRPQTLCFDCFRMEIGWRQAVAAQLARGWNASQARLPLEDTLRELSLRRRRAQIAARHALE